MNCDCVHECDELKGLYNIIIFLSVCVCTQVVEERMSSSASEGEVK